MDRLEEKLSAWLMLPAEVVSGCQSIRNPRLHAVASLEHGFHAATQRRPFVNSAFFRGQPKNECPDRSSPRRNAKGTKGRRDGMNTAIVPLLTRSNQSSYHRETGLEPGSFRQPATASGSPFRMASCATDCIGSINEKRQADEACLVQWKPLLLTIRYQT